MKKIQKYYENEPFGIFSKKTFRVMKLTILLSVLTVFQMFATESYSQLTKLTLKIDNVKISDALGMIEDQSDFYFLYSPKLIDVEKIVNIDVDKVLVQDILTDLFGESVKFSVYDRQIVLYPEVKLSELNELPQQQVVTGKITDAVSGEPLPGVNVMIKGTTIGAISDAQGMYSLSVTDRNITLLFSFIGYVTQETPLNGRSALDITLSGDILGLEEVIVIGYGTAKKSDLTGSVVSANIESFRETANVNIVQSLQGNVAGLNVGAITKQGQEPTISIRGLNTLGGATYPLVVLDEVIYRGRIVDINPADIKSVDILKDASATAIYGSQAANGVMIITTKTGIGSNTGKPTFTYSGSVGIQTPTNMWTPMKREQFFQKNKDVWWRQAYLAPDYTTPNPAYLDRSALVTIHQVEGYDDGTETDWLDATTQTGVLINNNLSMQTKTNNTSYFISLGSTNSKGYLINDDFLRYSVRLNVDNKILSWFRVGIQSFFSVSDYKGQDGSLSSVVTMSPLAKAYNPDGSLYLYPDGFLTPLYYQNVEQKNKYNTLYGNFYSVIDVPFLKGLTYRFDYSPNYRNRRFYSYNPYNLSEKGDAEKTYDNNFDYSLDNRVNYKVNFGKHFIEATLAAGREKRTYDYTRAYSGDFAMKGLGYNRLQDGTIVKQQTTTQAWQETSMYQMARLMYNFNDRYLLTGTVRRDGFSGFGENNKFGLFPSLALAWRFTEEGFLKDNLAWLNYGKLRISYGENGNRTVERYQTLSKMTSSYGYTFGPTSAMVQTPITMANPDLKWETTTSLNFGLDYGIFDSRINGSFDYYLSTTNDMLYQVEIPAIGGITSTYVNLGEIKNKGLEITLNTINMKGADFGWESTIAFSQNRNEIVTLLGRDDNNDGVEDNIISSNLFIGQPVHTVYSYNVLGLYQLGDTDIPTNSGPGLYKYEDLNDDGAISSQFDRKIIGYGDPSYRVSFSNRFTYKNFSLLIFLNSIQGGKDQYYSSIEGPTGGAIDDNVRKTNYGVEHSKYWWTPQNTDSPFKELFAYDPIQSYRYFQRSFVRLQDVSLSYRFDLSKLSRLKVQELSMFISGKNLYTWTKWFGQDPEVGSGFITDAPLLMNITYGINLVF
jgi:TonB-dependent starch-binding outer membrane protein SusC